jgi:hypothetical protein
LSAPFSTLVVRDQMETIHSNTIGCRSHHDLNPLNEILTRFGLEDILSKQPVNPKIAGLYNPM